VPSKVADVKPKLDTHMICITNFIRYEKTLEQKYPGRETRARSRQRPDVVDVKTASPSAAPVPLLSIQIEAPQIRQKAWPLARRGSRAYTSDVLVSPPSAVRAPADIAATKSSDPTPTKVGVCVLTRIFISCPFSKKCRRQVASISNCGVHRVNEHFLRNH
jgi:hypothetical protein